MAKLIDWLIANPSAFASVTSAIIAASVALFVFAVTQFITRKRDRTQFLLPKLEELYLLVNELAEQNAIQFKLFYRFLRGDKDVAKNIAEIDDIDLYGHRRGKKIIMYIRLYFPKLSRIHEMLFSAERELNILKFHSSSDAPPTVEELINASGRVGHFIRLIEQEIISNRDSLLGAGVFPKKYRETTEAEIEDEIPRPSGPIMHVNSV